MTWLAKLGGFLVVVGGLLAFAGLGRAGKDEETPPKPFDAEVLEITYLGGEASTDPYRARVRYVDPWTGQTVENVGHLSQAEGASLKVGDRLKGWTAPHWERIQFYDQPFDYSQARRNQLLLGGGVGLLGLIVLVVAWKTGRLLSN